MYVWIWRHLPGNWAAKLLGCLVLLAGVCALLFFFAFPWFEKHSPWNDVTVNGGRPDSTQSTSSPTTSPSP